MSATSSSEPYSTSDLDAVHSVVDNPIALKAFRESLTHGHLADGTSTIRAFTAMWSHPADHTTAEDLLWLLARMNNLKHLVLHVPLTQRRIPLGHMRALQSLNAEAALLRVLRAPHPPLRALSVYVLPADEASTYAAITRLFSKSLIKLRVLRTFDGPREEGSPARVCAALALPRLEYLEVRDLSAKACARILASHTEGCLTITFSSVISGLIMWTPWRAPLYKTWRFQGRRTSGCWCGYHHGTGLSTGR